MPALTQHRHVPGVTLGLRVCPNLNLHKLGDRKYNHACFTDEKTEALLNVPK